MFRKSGVVQMSQFRNRTSFFAIQRRITSRAPSLFYYSRPRFAEGDDKIIVFDTYSSTRFLRWLCRHYPDKRIIFWYWNKLDNPDRMKKIPPEIEVWSFSLTDSRRYSLRSNTQFFFDCLAPLAEEYRKLKPSDTPRVLFLGRDKGRADILHGLERELREAGAEVDLRIIPDVKGHLRGLREKLILPYGKAVELLRDVDVLLDYANDPDTGLSLRCMESLFFDKKLITNNREILEADFYDPANVYVLGEDTRTFSEFLRTPVRPADPEIQDRYLLSNWLKRFDTEGEKP